MKNINKINSLIELNDCEIETIEGGWNALEYLAMGIGYIISRFEHAPVGNFEYPGYGHPGGARP